MKFNEINKRLEGSDPQVRYIVTWLYEQFMEQQKQLDIVATTLVTFSDALGNLAKTDETFGKAIGTIQNAVWPNSNSNSNVHSEPIDGENSVLDDPSREK